jgi:outer membrane protein OmpA-like peptidoglycan-associated protein
MSIMTMRHRGSRDRARWRGRRLRHVAPLVLVGLPLALGAAPAAAQRTPQHATVQVDLGALDALGPAPAGEPTKGIRLHLPAALDAASGTRQAQPAGKSRQPTRSAASAATLSPDPSRIPPRPNLPPPAKSAVAAPSAASKGPAAQGAQPASSANQTAALTPNVGAPGAGKIEDRLLFSNTGDELSSDAKAELSQFAKRLAADTRLHVQIMAYAGGDGDPSQARRVSLARALAARSYLVDQGVDVKQVDVRPMGNRTEAGLPPDRVDLVLAER